MDVKLKDRLKLETLSPKILNIDFTLQLQLPRENYNVHLKVLSDLLQKPCFRLNRYELLQDPKPSRAAEVGAALRKPGPGFSSGCCSESSTFWRSTLRYMGRFHKAEVPSVVFIKRILAHIYRLVDVRLRICGS